ncbi:hypothetical protein [Pseudomonas sp. SWRI99]|uniref:hypothetical protein n=1 Tax=Pseudomonas sp. SWRI99 TaxID=2745506 RepID=UPI001EE31F45|nr:hypothetical protein [Pseudomonas sp. SWRI99]
MAVKPLTRVNVSVDVHALPKNPVDGHLSDTPVRTGPGLTTTTRNPPRTDSPTGTADLDAILPAPAVTVSEQPLTVTPTTSPTAPLEQYTLSANAALPSADVEGFRTFKGRRYVDLNDGRIVQVAQDPDTGLYRARLPSELTPSGPTLIRDRDSRRWRSMNDNDAIAPLTRTRLQAFGTDLDFSTATADSDGVFHHDGKLYVVIDKRGYQVLQDLDASTPAQKVWRIARSPDPVAADSSNVYRASRIGQTLAITRNPAHIWVAAHPGLNGGMRRNPQPQVSVAELQIMYTAMAAAHGDLKHSAARYNTLFAESRQQAEGSDAKTAALVAVEIQLIKHVKLQTVFVQSFIDNKDGLIRVKTRALYNEELHTFQLERVEYLNRLMAVMDLRIRPTVTALTADNFKKIITHMNKKLKLLEDRQGVIDQLSKAAPRTSFQFDEDFNVVPGFDLVNRNKLTAYLCLLSDNPENPPAKGMQTLLAIDLFANDLNNIAEPQQPMALMLADSQIRAEKQHFASLLSSASPENAGYLKEIISLIEPFEQRIDSKLSDIFATFRRRGEPLSLDQDIDFDFVPKQTLSTETATPAPARKVFRTRQHGLYKVLVGEKEVAADGNIIVKVADPFRPDGQPQRYEKRQGEWLPVRPQTAETPKPLLVAQAHRLLSDVAGHLVEAKTRESRHDNPTDILEYLGKAADRLSEHAHQLAHHPEAATDTELTGLTDRLRSAGDSLSAEGQRVLVRMYKNRDVLDIMRLNYLLDHAALSVTRTVERKQIGKGRDKSFLDVYSISDRADDAPLWEAHFHYEKHDSLALNFTVKGGHLKTLEQAGRGASSQRRDEQAGLPHVAIWRETIDGRTARKIFDLAT